MKVYLASRFTLIPQVESVASILECRGHEITCKWWSREYQIPGEGKVKTTVLKERTRTLSAEAFYKLPDTRFSYLADLQGIKDADAFIFVAGYDLHPFNGANVELGIALALGKPCYIYGRLPLSVMYYNTKFYDLMMPLLEDMEAEDHEI